MRRRVEKRKGARGEAEGRRLGGRRARKKRRKALGKQGSVGGRQESENLHTVDQEEFREREVKVSSWITEDARDVTAALEVPDV